MCTERAGPGAGAVLAVWCCAVAVAAAAAAGELAAGAQRLHAGVGGFAVMNCHLDFPFGNEIPYHLHWDKDGETIFSWHSGDAAPHVAERWGGRLRRVGGSGALGAGSGALGAGSGALGGGSINVSAVRDTDAGLYRCRVSFPNRTPPQRHNGTLYALDVDGAGGNLIVTPPSNLTVVSGERAELRCGARDPAAAAPVTWHRARDQLPAPPPARRNGSLVLPDARPEHAGRYECRVRDGRKLHTAAAFLDVQYKARVVHAPSERHLQRGAPASLDCHFSANPPLTNLRWEKDGFLFDPYNVPGVFYSRNGSLLFNEVSESHEGDYSCTPYNALGSAGASPRVRVRVLPAPALRLSPPALHLARAGAAATLPCAPAQPALHITWTRSDGASLPAGRHSLDGGNLTIADVADDDAGQYVCTARDRAGASASAATLLRVENARPRAPHSLTARPQRRALHLAWQPGRSGADAEYTVWYRERDEPEWRTMRILSRGVTEATLLGLRDRTQYELRVLAQDHLGDGLFSRPVRATTLPGDEGAEPEADHARGTTGAAADTTGDEDDGDGGDDAGPGPGPAAEEAGAEGEAAASGGGGGGESLSVSVRLVDEGALVRWRRGEGGGGRCTVRWYEGAESEPALALHTHRDYVLVGSVSEGAQYRARVRCADGAAGGAALRVPEYARLRGVAAGAAAAALLLAALAGALALLLARRRRRRGDRSHPTRADKHRC